jgi:hypothetical protein
MAVQHNKECPFCYPCDARPRSLVNVVGEQAPMGLCDDRQTLSVVCISDRYPSLTTGYKSSNIST